MKLLVAALILLFLPLQALDADYPARVVGITDGDTLTVLRDGKTQVKIRLASIDAPETGQDFGSREASRLRAGVREAGDDPRYGH